METGLKGNASSSWLEHDPDRIYRTSKEELESCLAEAEAIMRNEAAFLEVTGKVLFVGDTHGDFTITKEVSKRFFADKTQKVVFLGDYIDRAPEDLGTSVPNVSYLMFLKCAFPGNIVLLKGNHEANYAIPCFPYEFRNEIESQYPGFHGKFVKAFTQMPLMVAANNVIASHGGIPKDYDLPKLRAMDKNDLHAIEAITWSDPATSNTDRGAGMAFTADELRIFLQNANAKLLVRGHDYNTLGMAIFNRTCLTLFSSRAYQEMGNKGILIASVENPISGLEDLLVESYQENMWRRYDVKIL